ncbi:hypothetical protein NIES73_08420 [Sphaerospermopsis kisseleviana NIES-73]|nr:hypothetical protein NIES73_08420 [Sphaerospermopsis kisseleviana NIES-73]
MYESLQPCLRYRFARRREIKFTYLFGNLAVDDSVSAILLCATQYYTSPKGLLP